MSKPVWDLCVSDCSVLILCGISLFLRFSEAVIRKNVRGEFKLVNLYIATNAYENANWLNSNCESEKSRGVLSVRSCFQINPNSLQLCRIHPHIVGSYSRHDYLLIFIAFGISHIISLRFHLIYKFRLRVSFTPRQMISNQYCVWLLFTLLQRSSDKM